MRRLLAAALLLAATALPAHGRERVSGWCEQGGNKTTTGGLTSTESVQQSFPSCTVTIYDVGTLNLASIFADDSGTVKSNPFTATASGFWFFLADDARYDIRFSGGGIVTPFTIGDILLDDTKNDVTTIVSVASSATPTFDASLGTIFTNTLTANVTSSTISNPVTGQRITIYLAQDGTGGWTFAWPANVQLRSSGYVVSDDASAVSTISLYYDGTNWRELSRYADEVGYLLLPVTSGDPLGSTTRRWNLFGQVLNVAGASTLTGVVTAGNDVDPSATGNNLGDSSFLWDAYIRGNQIAAVRIVGGDFATVQAANDDCPNDGCDIYIPPGTHVGPTSIKNGVKLHGVGSVTKAAIDAHLGTLQTTSPSNTIQVTTLQYSASSLTLTDAKGVGLYNFVFDFQDGGGLILRNPFDVDIDRVLIDNTDGNTAFEIRDNPATTQNSAFVRIGTLWIVDTQVGVKLNGDSDSPVTGNWFDRIYVIDATQTALEFTQHADSNFLRNFMVLALPNTARCVIFNNSATPTANTGIDSNIIDNLWCDAASQAGYSTQAVLFNQSRGNRIRKGLWIIDEADERSVANPTTTTFWWEDGMAGSSIAPEIEVAKFISNKLSSADGVRMQWNRDNVAWMNWTVEGGVFLQRDVTASGDWFIRYNPATRQLDFKRGTTGNVARLTLITNTVQIVDAAFKYADAPTLAASTTPSVAVGNVFLTNSTASITDFTGEQNGQVIILLCGADTTTSLTDSTPLFLAGAFTCSAGDSITLVSDGTVWTEMSRSVN